MSNKKKPGSYINSKSNGSKSKTPIIIGIISVVIVVAVIIIAYAITSKSSNPEAVGASENQNTVETSPEAVGASENKEAAETSGSEGGDVVIVKSDITENAKFYPYTADDGTVMEILAFKASDGTIRTAFNTCEVCQNSGRGYYVQEGSVLVCQNCGRQFPSDNVGIEVGGCNPVPIMDEDKTEDDETITVTGDFIAQYTPYFQRWKD